MVTLVIFLGTDSLFVCVSVSFNSSISTALAWITLQLYASEQTNVSQNKCDKEVYNSSKKLNNKFSEEHVIHCVRCYLLSPLVSLPLSLPFVPFLWLHSTTRSHT